MSLSLASDIVELVILTTDEVFLQTLREAVGASRRLWHVPTADKVSDLLVAGQVGILILDVTALHEPAGGFLTEIKRQFPDLVVIVAGKRDAESSLTGLISTGSVYRFIHKPVSPGRAKLFADAAVKKFEEQRRRMPAAPVPVKALTDRRGLWAIAALVALVALTALLLVAWVRHVKSGNGEETPRAGSVDPREGDSPLLAQAAAALAANRLMQPVGDNALELYLRAIARNPSDAAARAGLVEVRERLAARAENALLEERLDEAAAAIETARAAGVDGARIAFLRSQLARARDQQKPAGGHPQIADARSDRTTADDRLAQTVSLAAQRIAQGRLIEPDHDNALGYVREARRLDPHNRSAQAAEELLAAALLAEARAAITRRDFDHAVTLLDAADGIAPPANVDSLESLLRTARRQVQDASPARAAPALGQSAAPGRADTVPVPGATTSTGAATAASPATGANTATGAAPTTAGSAMAPIPAPGDGAPVRREPDDAAAKQKSPDDVVGADKLTLLKSVTPVYPSKAEWDKTTGWVDLYFTVTSTGTVDDIEVRDASPPGTFDAAAVAALAQWRYQPVLRAGIPTAQRARLRIRFALPGDARRQWRGAAP